MKKGSIIIYLMAVVAMTSCASVKEKAKEFATQLHDADTNIEKITKIEKEVLEYRSDLSQEEKAEFDKAFVEAENKLTQKEFENSSNRPK